MDLNVSLIEVSVGERAFSVVMVAVSGAGTLSDDDDDDDDDGDEDSSLTGSGRTPTLFVALHSANEFPSGQQALSVQYQPISQTSIFLFVWLVS